MKRCSKVSEDEEEDLLSFPPYIKRHKGIFEFINSNHSSLQYFSIPHGYREIADEAFSGCYSLKNIVIPESITSIGSGAFRGCFSLVNITIPHVISIEAEVFTHTHTVCVPYYKAAPYNISHTKKFSRRFSL